MSNSKKSVQKFALFETLKKTYFAEMTGIGPRCSPRIEDAAVFDDIWAAKRSPAYCHSYTFFEPVLITITDGKREVSA